jgi:methane/ammonia monooxygenase subunit B
MAILVRIGRQVTYKRLVLIAVGVIVGAMINAAELFAHGEAADEPFLKVLTAAFYDVSISPTEIQVGQEVTITGTVRVLDTWPFSLDPPGRAYVNTVVPGPVFLLKERTVNDEPAPHSIFVERGGVYHFRMVVIGRQPGRWHVHPGVAFEGTGTLIGPGEYVTVSGSAAGFSFPVTLMSGQTINLDTYGGQFVWWWNFAGFVIGVIWMFWWTWWGHRTITNLAVTIQVPLNDDAPDIGLITPTDHKWCNVMAGATILLLVIGWIYMSSNYPVRLPQQTVWLTPSPVSPEEELAEVKAAGNARYEAGTGTLQMNVQVTNVASSPITLKQYITGMATFVNGGEAERAKAGPADFVGRLQVTPNDPIGPGETRQLTLRIISPIFDEERLIPIGDPQQAVAGLLRFERTDGEQQMVLLRSTVLPTSYGAL